MSRTVEVVGAVVSVAMAPGSVGVDKPGNVDTQALEHINARNPVVVTRGTDTSFGDVLAKHELSFGVSNNQPNGGRPDILPSLGTDYSSAFKAANRVYVDPDSLLSQQYLSANPDLTNYLRQGNSEPEVEPSEEFISQPVSEDVRQEVLSQLPESFMFTVIKEDGTTELIQYIPRDLDIYTTEIPEEYILVDPDTFEIVGIFNDTHEIGNNLFIPAYRPREIEDKLYINYNVRTSALHQDIEAAIVALDEMLSLVSSRFINPDPYSKIITKEDRERIRQVYRVYFNNLEGLEDSQKALDVSALYNASVREWYLGLPVEVTLHDAFMGEFPESAADYINAALRLLVSRELEIALAEAHSLLDTGQEIKITIPTIYGPKEIDLSKGITVVDAVTLNAFGLELWARRGTLHYNQPFYHIDVRPDGSIIFIVNNPTPMNPIGSIGMHALLFTFLESGQLPGNETPQVNRDFLEIFTTRTEGYSGDSFPVFFGAVTTNNRGGDLSPYFYSDWQR